MNITPTEMTPGKFYNLIKILESVDEKQITQLSEFREAAAKAAVLVQEQCSVLSKANNDMMQEARTSMRTQNRFDSLEKQSSDFENFTDKISDVNFLLIAFDTVRSIQVGYMNLLEIARGLKPKRLLLSDNNFDLGKKSIEDIKNMTYEFSLNAPAINSFLLSLKRLENMQKFVGEIADKVYRSLDVYYRKLLHRHTVEGVKIHRDPVITDIAIMLFKNIDAHGELAEGKEVDKVSAYTVRKAQILADALREKSIHKFVQDPGALIKYLQMNLKAFKDAANNLQMLFKKQLEDYKNSEDDYSQWRSDLTLDFLDGMFSSSDFERILTLISDVDPRNVSYTEPNKLLSADERFNLKFRDETIERLANMLADPELSAEEIVKYVLERKGKLHKYFQEENSFYVSKIGGGNSFTGLAPGGLEIVPGPKPISNLDEIVGSGFDEVRKFIRTIDDAAEWNDLFLATSPSRTTDKSNVLLIGPVGCLAGDTYIRYEIRNKDGERINHKGGTIERLYQRFNKLPKQHAGPQQKQDVLYSAPSINDERRVVQNQIKNVIFSGEKECFEVTISGGEKVVATADHEFFVGDKYVQLNELSVGDSVFVHRNIYNEDDKKEKTSRLNKRSYVYVKHHPVCGTKKVGKYSYKRLAKSRAIIEAHLNDLSFENYIIKLNNGKLYGVVVHNCGKTEVFRAVGADKDSISISVQGSDFNTCWKGEMEKNPKRLFEGALRLHKESQKQVHILIDEVDSVMNNDKTPGETNLSLEFQILMDGVVHYPRISIWGATNNPERIPMAMVRRFSKVVIVGELDSDDRITLLKHFSSYLPRDTFGDRDWKSLADRLEGATGDVVRKMIDHIWREKLSWFVHDKPEAAKEIMATLSRENQFELSNFTPKDRFNFNQKLGKYFKVSPRDISKSIDIHLDNIAIKTEIDTAKRTYANAKAFLSQLSSSKIVMA